MSNRVIVIAEAGVCHNGSLKMAKELVDVAKDSGADFVKFQTFKADSLVTRSLEKAEYQKVTSGAQESMHKMLRKLELTESMHSELIEHCKEVGIPFLSTPFDVGAAEYLDDKVDVFKSPSGEVTNIPYLEFLASKGKPIVLSTGGSYLGEVEVAVEAIRRVWIEQGLKAIVQDKADALSIPALTVLQCTSSYPAPQDQLNISAMDTIRESCAVEVGFSDHSLGILAPIVAASKGARIIEKHFTLDRNFEGPDHQASLEPGELKDMISSIRNVEQMLGSGEKVPAPCEEINIHKIRKGLHFKDDFSKGHVLREKDIAIKRPANGLEPARLKDVIGRQLICGVTMDEAVEKRHFQELRPQ